MNVSCTASRPHTRLAAALVAAGVASAAAVTTVPERPTVGMNVANVSVVTDALSGVGKGVEVLTSLVGIHVDATVSLPFEATLAVLAAQQHPELSANVLSYLVQRFVNPAVGAPIYAYPWETEQTAALVASLLPYPFGGLVEEARLAFADAFDGVLGQLPDPLPGFDVVQAIMNDTALGGAVVAGQLAVRAPLYMAWNMINYLGNVPVNVEATIESALHAPGQIPGLLSNLVYGLLSPKANVGLLGQLLDNAVDPLTWLPGPIGFGSSAAVGLANQVRAVIVAAMNGVLSALPTPVKPAALPAGTAAGGRPIYSVGAGKGDAPDSLPSASLALASPVGLVPAAPAETPSEATVSKAAPADDGDAPAAPATAHADTAPADTAGTTEGVDTETDSPTGPAQEAGHVEVRPGKAKQGKETDHHGTHPSTRGDTSPAPTGASADTTGSQGAAPSRGAADASPDGPSKSTDAA